MRFHLYRVEIQRADRTAIGYLVSTDEERASEIVIANEIHLNEENQGFALERVDETLPPNMRKGLDCLLEHAPVGFASYSEKIGWMPHTVPTPKLHLWRIDEVAGARHFVIAPSGDVAVWIYCETIGLDDQEPRTFSVEDGLFGIKNEALKGLPALLEFGPIGMVEWDKERGWSLV